MFLDSVLRRISGPAVSSGAQSAVPTAPADIHAAIARTLAHGLPIAADPTGAQHRLAVVSPSKAASHSKKNAGALGYVRTQPVSGALDTLGAPPWAHGMAIAQTAGPFVDEHGIPSWIDTIVPLSKQLALVRGGVPIAYLQATSVVESKVPAGTKITLGPGSLWIPARELASDAPANGFAGIAFGVATLIVPGGLLPSTTADVLVIGPTVTADLEITPAVAPPPVTIAANDSSGASALLPVHVRFAFEPDGAHVTALDDASLIAYGVTATFTGGAGAVAYDTDLAEIAITYGSVSSPASFAVNASTSPTFTLRGTAPVVAGTYRIPVAQTTSAALGPAAGGGALGLSVASGMTGRWGSLAASTLFASALVHVQTGVLGIVARTARRPFSDRYELWDARATAPAVPVPTSLVLQGPRGTVVRTAESVAGELVIATGCRIEANIDRPLLGNGTTPSVAAMEAAYWLIHSGADTTLLVEAVPAPLPATPTTLIGKPRPAAFVIENALLRTSGVAAIFAYGKLDGTRRAAQGVLFIGNALDRLVPMLPDPYASNLDLRHEIVAELLVAIAAWPAPADPQLAFVIQRPQQGNDAVAPLALFSADANAQGRLAQAQRGSRFATMFDVSSAQSQFGVVATGEALAQSQILGQQLNVSAQQSALFAIPAIAWEPVLDVDRRWFSPFSTTDGDGPPGIVAVPTVTLRPLEPKAFYDAFLVDYAAGADLFASITLPFGLTATIDTNAALNTSPAIARPELHAVEPTFAGDRTGGKQLSLRGIYDAANERTVMPGFSLVQSTYAGDMLDKENHIMGGMWDQDFGNAADPARPQGQHFVPLARYDLSGYGASTFSEYDLDKDEVGVKEARFDVIVGRTVYELVEVQSFILPWHIPVVDTTIFERDATGYVNRYNTGWRAKDNGVFAFPGVAPATDVERGGVLGVYNVRNIVVAGPEVVAGHNYRRVTFDADVQIAVSPDPHPLKITGGDASGIGRVPSKGLTGYLVLDAGDVPDLAEAIRVVDALGAATGPIAAEVDVNGTAIKLGLTGVEVGATRPDVVRAGAFPRTLAAALRGTPRLPRDGSWSVGTRAASSSTPQPLPPTTPVPLMRSVADPATWRIADAADVVKFDDPLHFYGILQATGANKVFFEHPTIKPGTHPFNFDKTPKLADVGKLLGDNGLLPDILSLLDFGSFDGLAPNGDGFSLKQQLVNAVDLGDRTLLPLGPIHLGMSSWSDAANPPAAPATAGKPTTITLDLDPSASPRWKIAINNIAFTLEVDGWGPDPLITVHGDATAQDGSAPTVSNLGVKYGESLSIVKSILTTIEQFISFLPGAAKEAGLDVSFQGSKLRVREAFPLPKLPLGLGYLEDISLDLGFDVDVIGKKLSFFVGIGDDQNPFHWLVSPLSGNGMLQLGATDKMGVVMQAGIGLGLAIDLAIVSGSASIVIAVRFDATSSPIGVMVLLTGQASVDVLDGLASASLTLTAGVGVKVSPGNMMYLLEIPPDPIAFLKDSTVTLMAEVAVGVHISLCWVVHIDFDGSWPFSETISGKALVPF